MFNDRKKRLEKAKKFVEKSAKEYGDCGIMAPQTPAQVALNEIIHHLLGDKWYVVDPLNQEQVNTVAVYEIIQHYKTRGIFK